ncbi:MAG: nitroreductase family protein [Ureaplasma sp.]|nr:nitroreductase family protein [Ureaplasma sp.]
MKTKLLKRCSVRKYKNKVFSDKVINEIIDVINSSPTSSNSHQFSVNLVTDQKLKDELAIVAMNQKHISQCSVFVVFNVDLTSIRESIKNLDDKLKTNAFLISMTDLTISSTMLQDWAVLNNYGTCYIGAIRRNIKEAQKVLKLPENVIPVLGLCIGVSDQKLTNKPKLNKVFMNDNYNNIEFANRMKEYDKTMFEYYEQKHPEMSSMAFYNHNIRTYDINDVRNNSVDFDFINDIINIAFKK